MEGCSSHIHTHTRTRSHVHTHSYTHTDTAAPHVGSHGPRRSQPAGGVCSARTPARCAPRCVCVRQREPEALLLPSPVGGGRICDVTRLHQAGGHQPAVSIRGSAFVSGEIAQRSPWPEPAGADRGAVIRVLPDPGESQACPLQLPLHWPLPITQDGRVPSVGVSQCGCVLWGACLRWCGGVLCLGVGGVLCGGVSQMGMPPMWACIMWVCLRWACPWHGHVPGMGVSSVWVCPVCVSHVGVFLAWARLGVSVSRCGCILCGGMSQMGMPWMWACLMWVCPTCGYVSCGRVPCVGMFQMGVSWCGCVLWGCVPDMGVSQYGGVWV